MNQRHAFRRLEATMSHLFKCLLPRLLSPRFSSSGRKESRRQGSVMKSPPVSVGPQWYRIGKPQFDRPIAPQLSTETKVNEWMWRLAPTPQSINCPCHRGLALLDFFCEEPVLAQKLSHYVLLPARGPHQKNHSEHPDVQVLKMDCMHLFYFVVCFMGVENSFLLIALCKKGNTSSSWDLIMCLKGRSHPGKVNVFFLTLLFCPVVFLLILKLVSLLLSSAVWPSI